MTKYTSWAVTINYARNIFPTVRRLLGTMTVIAMYALGFIKVASITVGGTVWYNCHYENFGSNILPLILAEVIFIWFTTQ